MTWDYLFLLGSSGLFVGLIYVFPLSNSHSHDRNHPTTILQRLISTSSGCLIVAMFLNFFVADDALYRYLWMNIDVNAVYGVGYSLIITCILFFGPIFTEIVIERRLPFQFDLTDSDSVVLENLRDLILAPFLEEFMFRGCFLAFCSEARGWSYLQRLWVIPLFFSAAHAHHVISNPSKWQITLFQCVYTYIFGVYATFILLVTRSLWAAVFAHMLCNALGLPPFLDHLFLTYKRKPKMLLLIRLAYVVGLALFLGVAAVSARV